MSIWPLIGDVKFNHLLKKHLQNCLSLKMLFSPFGAIPSGVKF